MSNIDNGVSRELDHARELIGSALILPDHYLDIITLACALTHKTDDFRTAPRVLVLGEMGSGKSQVLEVASYLVRQDKGAPVITGIHQITAPGYVANYKLDPYYVPMIDEINHLFGEAGGNGKQSEKRGLLNQGYKRRTAVHVKMRGDVPDRTPIFGVVFMAGLGNAAPPDLRERSVLINMAKLKSKPEFIADFAKDGTEAAFNYARVSLASWIKRTGRLSVTSVQDAHPKLFGRKLDVWGPLLAVAKAAGETWFKRALTAFEIIECEEALPVYVPEDQILVDYLDFSDQQSDENGLASGEFASWALRQEHGAYLYLTPRQFQRFAVANLGPTSPWYNGESMVRGWSHEVHEMNLDRARDRKTELEGAVYSDDTDPMDVVGAQIVMDDF